MSALTASTRERKSALGITEGPGETYWTYIQTSKRVSHIQTANLSSSIEHVAAAVSAANAFSLPGLAMFTNLALGGLREVILWLRAGSGLRVVGVLLV